MAERLRLVAPLAAALLALLSLPFGAEPAYAECLANPDGSPGTIVFVCDPEDDVTFDVALGALRHNRKVAGDPGFDSETDFNTTAANTQPVANSASSVIKVFTGTGANDVTIGTSSSPASTIRVRFELALNQGNDSVTIDDSANLAEPKTTKVGATLVDGPGGVVTYDDAEVLTIKAGGAADQIRVSSAAAGTATTIRAGGGNDLITVGTEGSLDAIRGPLTIEGGNDSDELRVHDDFDTTSNTYTLAATTLQRAGAALLTFSAVERYLLTAGAGDDTITVDDLPSGATLGVTLEAGAGNDRVIWDAVSSTVPAAVEGRGGTDTFQFNGPATGTFVTALLCNARLTFVPDCAATSGRLSLGTVEQVAITGSPVRDDIHVGAGVPGTAVTINGLAGNDFLSVLSVAPGSTVTIDAGAGDDRVCVGYSCTTNPPGSPLSIQGPVTVDGGAGTNHLDIEARRRQPAMVPQAGAATVTVTPTQVGAGPGDNYFGPGGSVTYAGFQTLGLDGYDVNDTVRVIPSATTAFFFDGEQQSTEDTLDVDLTGTTGATLALDVLQGEIRFADRRPVTFEKFETRLANGRPIAGLIAFDAASFGAAESGGPATVTVTRTSPLGVATVQLATGDGTATGGRDYAPVSLTVQFAEGETSKTATIPILGDALVEDDETINLTLSSAVGLVGEAALGPRSTAVLVIDDSGAGDDRQEAPRPAPPGQLPPGQQPGAAPALPVVSIDDARMAEGNARSAALVFTVRLSAPAARPVAVDFATTDLTARSVRFRGAPPDFLARRGRLTIPAGRTGGAIAIPVLGDALGEPDERFRVTLNRPVGATLGRATAVGEILDDDLRPARLFVNDVSVAEGGAGRTVLRFDVRLTRSAAGPVRFTLATADITARARTDYAPVGGSLTIPAGQVSRAVAVPVLGDTAVEPEEQLRLVLARVTGAAVLDGVAVGRILNDDR